MARLQKKEENRKWKLGRQVSIFAKTINNFQKWKSRNLAAEFPFSTFCLFCFAGFPFLWKWEKLGRVSKICLFNPLQSTTTHFYFSASNSASLCARTHKPLQRLSTLLKKFLCFPRCAFIWLGGVASLRCVLKLSSLQWTVVTFVHSLSSFNALVHILLHSVPHVVGVITDFRHSWWVRLSFLARTLPSEWVV